MILTITMNPSVDINYQLDSLQLDNVNRVSTVSKTAGGKGLNVARVLSQLDENVATTGLLGGTIGDYIKNQLHDQKIPEKFMGIEKESRNCIAIIHDKGKQTEVLESGPVISEEEGQAFLKHLQTLLDDVKVVTISGSLPKGLPDDYYIDVIKKCNEKKIDVVLDTSGNVLKNVLASPVKPFAIKPNMEELEGLFSEAKDITEETIASVLQSEAFKGITCVLVSNGSKGSFVKWGEKTYKLGIPKVDAINPVGSGDATVAGLASALHKQKSIEEAMKTAMTTGVLNALNEKTGFIDADNFASIFSQITVEELN
ncbi:MAG: hexose kinase [Alkalibacterium gilvum]|uniref:hexose kinase n=2 Tax=Alkalibacterium gilvum TaxID=1130080 RepID=UPI003F8E4671